MNVWRYRKSESTVYWIFTCCVGKQACRLNRGCGDSVQSCRENWKKQKPSISECELTIKFCHSEGIKTAGHEKDWHFFFLSNTWVVLCVCCSASKCVSVHYVCISQNVCVPGCACVYVCVWPTTTKGQSGSSRAEQQGVSDVFFFFLCMLMPKVRRKKKTYQREKYRAMPACVCVHVGELEETVWGIAARGAV